MLSTRHAVPRTSEGAVIVNLPPPNADASPAPDDPFAGGGEAGDLLRAIDWSRKPIGPVACWPQSLRTALSICLSSRHPICIIWGRDRLYLYNDAYAPIVGAKHPWALGESYITVWPEIWESAIKPILESVERTGEASWCDNLLLVLQRRGFNEECYFSFSFAPTRVEDGSVGGVFTAITETTPQIVGERRLRTLRDLGAQATSARTPEEACRLAAEALATNRHDLPFVLFYLLSADGASARLVEHTGIAAEAPGCAAQIALRETEPPTWPLLAALGSGEPLVVRPIPSALGALPGGPWPEPAHTAVILPIARAGQSMPYGFIVAGVSPRRVWDDDYRSFLKLAATQVATAISNAEAYAEERRRAEALAEIDRAKTAFFGNVSHEFRTPLTLMLGPLEDLLAKSDASLAPESRTQLEITYRNSLRLLKLVNTMLDFSRIEAGRIQASYEPVDLARFTAELASVFRAAIEKAGLRLTIDCPPTSAPAYVDRDMWEKIVFNLLSNALKFTLQGEIEIRVREDGHAFHFSVRDTGVGIPAAELPNVFKRFHRIENIRSRTHEGTGIGLALVHELAKLHGGGVAVASQLDVGSTFTVTLPAGRAHLPADRVAPPRSGAVAASATPFIEESLRWLPDPAPASHDHARPGVPGGSATERPRVLVADDNADMRLYLRRLLETDYEVETVGDGEAALEAIERFKPALLLTDVMMPRLDGYGLLAALRSRPNARTLPVIVLSARAGQEASSEGYAAGADDYLIKPFTARELLARVAAHLRMTRLRREVAVQTRALQASEMRSEQLMQLMPLAVSVCDAEGRVRFCNRRVAELLHAEPRIGELWRDFARQFEIGSPGGPPAPQGETPMMLALREGRSYRDVELSIQRPDGTAFIASANIEPLTGEQGEIVGVINAFHDITERHRAAAQAGFLAQLGERIGLLGDAGEITRTTMQALGEHLGANRCYFFESDPDLSRIKVTENWRRAGFASLAGDYDLLAFGSADWWERMARGRIQTADIENEPRLDAKRFAALDIRSFAVAPFTHEGRWVAGLVVTSSVPRRWTDDELTLLENIVARVWPLVERARAAAAARRISEQLEATLVAANIGRWVWDIARDRLTGDRNFAQWFGMPPAEQAGAPLEVYLPVIHPDDRERVMQTVGSALESGAAGYEAEYRLCPPDGRQRWIVARGTIERDADQRPRRMSGVVIDVTRRREAEDAIRQLAAIVENSEDAIFSQDLEGAITNWNRGAERLYGYSAAEIVGRSVDVLVPAEASKGANEPVARVIRGEIVEQLEAVHCRKDGSLAAVSQTLSPIRDPGGRIVGVSRIARDISARRRAEMQQQALYQLVATVNRTADLPEIYDAALTALCRCHDTERASLLLCDAGDVMRFQACRNLSAGYRRAVEGHSPWAPAERNPRTVWIEDTSAAELPPELRAAAEREGIRALAFIPLTYEQRLLGKFMLYYPAPRRFAAENVRLAETIASQVAFAIARRRDAEALEALVNERTASLREAIAQMEEFSYSVSHDLRSPVRAMRGYAEAVLEDYGAKLDDEGRELLGRIRKNGERMDRLIQDLLTYSRLSLRLVALEPVALETLLHDVIQQYPEMQPPRAEIAVAGPLPTVLAHEPSLTQVFSNLLSNAVKFVAPGTHPRVRVRAESHDRQVRLWFEDNGIGIDPQCQSRLFGMFERVHPDKKYEGTGIGLAIVRRAVERMNGRVGLESDGRTGSRFWIELTREPAS